MLELRGCKMFFTVSLRFSDRRLARLYGIIRVLPGIELRGDGGTNGSHEGRRVETDRVLLRTDREA